MTGRSTRVVALLARRPGQLVLEALLEQPDLELATVFTHGRLPRGERAGERPELGSYRHLCESADIPLLVVDDLAARDISGVLPPGPLDLLVALSWRYLVPQHVLDRFERGCVNVHRGALPTYAGALPVQRAIEAGETVVSLTAHEMIAEIDAGRRIAEARLQIAPLGSGRTAAAYAEEVKSALHPLYAPLVQLAIRTRLLDATD